MDLIDFFNQRVTSEIHPKSILIATTNAIVDKKNMDELQKLPWKWYQSHAFIAWDYPQDAYPADKVLTLKVWARVMFTYNHKFWDYVNGTLWTIIWISENSQWFINWLKVEKDDGWIISVQKNKWDNVVWEDEDWQPIITWNFNQFPIKLAFAITVHKVQWKTFDHITIDLWRWAFVDWQVYVAISRVKTFKWLQLITPIREKDIIASMEVKKFLSPLQ